MTPLTDKENDYHEKQKIRYICQKRFSYDKKQKQKYKLYKKLGTIAILQVNIEVQHILFVT